MWADFKPLMLTRVQFSQRIAELTWTTWRPIGIILHNTSAPTLAQWVESGDKHDARIRNLESYYEGMGWKGGPHWFISRNFINEFNNPLRQGTHSPSFNKTHFGIEMVGDYDQEHFNNGDGAKVRDMAVFVMAALCSKFGWDPAAVIKLHKEDPKTTHECPGSEVDKADVIRRVKERMSNLPWMPAPAHPAAPEDNTDIYATEFGGNGDEQMGAYGKMVDPTKPQVALPFKFRNGRSRVAVRANGREVLCEISDVGPWNIDDPYWTTGGRPRAEDQHGSGKQDFKGRTVTNQAGIDLTRAAMDQLGIKGKAGTRSATVDWNFTDEVSPDVWQPKPPVAPPVDDMPDDDAPAAPPEKVDAVTVEVIQRKLIKLGYKEVGLVDGKMGGRVRGAIAAFKADRGISPPVGEIDAAFRDELVKAEAESWTRPIKEERSGASEATIERKAPEITPVKQNRFMAFWGSISAAAAAAISALGDHFKDVLGTLSDVKDRLGDVPGWVWLGMAAGVLLFFYIKSKQGTDAISDSYRQGDRN